MNRAPHSPHDRIPHDHIKGRNVSSTSRRITGTWLVLVVATLMAWGLAEQDNAHFGPPLLAACMLALAALKGLLVALEFMELRHAPALWRRLVLGWFIAVMLLLLFASLIQALL